MECVSVCMATYNGERFIRQQLLSILSQLSLKDEVVISDDGSTDTTLEIIDQLADQRIKVSTNTGYPGPMGNFEQAIMKASHSLILLADQDDIWLPDKVDKIRELLKSNDLVLSDCQVVNEKGVVIHESFFRYRGSKPGFWNNVYRNSYVGCCMAFRKEITEYILPFPQRVHMHDWWIGLLVELKGHVCFYPKPLIRYVRHGNNASPTGEKGYGMIERLRNRFFLVACVVDRLWR